MVVGDQALTWYGAFRQLMTEVIDETCRTIPPHATRHPRQDLVLEPHPSCLGAILEASSPSTLTLVVDDDRPIRRKPIGSPRR
jgi:hypothetical protein